MQKREQSRRNWQRKKEANRCRLEIDVKSEFQNNLQNVALYCLSVNVYTLLVCLFVCIFLKYVFQMFMQ